MRTCQRGEVFERIQSCDELGIENAIPTICCSFHSLTFLQTNKANTSYNSLNQLSWTGMENLLLDLDHELISSQFSELGHTLFPKKQSN